MSENLPAEVGTTALDLPDSWDRRGDVVIAFAEHMDTRWRIANMLVQSGMIREKKPEAVMAIQLKAFEMGVPLMQALGGMYFVDGKVALEGHLMDALAIQRCGVKKTVLERSDARCKMTLHREGWDPLPVEYTMEDAQRAGLVTITDDGFRSTKKNWTKHPKQMLYWRALSDGLRQIAPDYFGGTYTLDELESAAEIRATIEANRSTNDEVNALIAKGTDPVEPDPDALTEDEMDALAKEAALARKNGLITTDRETEIQQAIIGGEWVAAREAWEEIRIELARAEADEEQGALL
jgi:hypothetical protein